MCYLFVYLFVQLERSRTLLSVYRDLDPYRLAAATELAGAAVL